MSLLLDILEDTLNDRRKVKITGGSSPRYFECNDIVVGFHIGFNEHVITVNHAVPSGVIHNHILPLLRSLFPGTELKEGTGAYGAMYSFLVRGDEHKAFRASRVVAILAAELKGGGPCPIYGF